MRKWRVLRGHQSRRAQGVVRFISDVQLSFCFWLLIAFISVVILCLSFTVCRSLFRLSGLGRPCSGWTLRLVPADARSFPGGFSRSSSGSPLDAVGGQQLVTVVQQWHVFVRGFRRARLLVTLRTGRYSLLLDQNVRARDWEVLGGTVVTVRVQLLYNSCAHGETKVSVVSK